jgi:predicted nucleic acid-binding protein
VKAVFADAFYWTALTSIDDSAHRQALALSRSLQPDKIITTEEVLDEYLAYFSGARRSVREHAGDMVASLLDSRKIVNREGLTDVLTNDRHFEQEGFRALFRS